MKVVILAGGYGTRFGKLTDLLPKPMIPIGPYPMLWHIMRSYSHFGFDEFIICAGYKSELIKEFFNNFELYTSDLVIDFGAGGSTRRSTRRFGGLVGSKVTIAYTGQDTMTGGRVKRIRSYLGDDEEFMLTYGDGVTDANLQQLVKFHRQHGKIATLTAVYPPAKFGDLKFDGDAITDFAEKKGNQGAMINGGFYMFNRELLNYLDDETSCILEKGPLERLAQEGQLMAYKHTGYWQCMDTTRDLEGLQSAWSRRAAPWKVWADDYQD